MSHEVETMAYNMVEVPWHSLGVPVVGDLTPEQMMQKAGVDWNVLEVPSFAPLEVNGEVQNIETGQKALVRDSDFKVLTNVGMDWKPVQNSQAFAFFNEFVNEAGNMSMETAGSLKGGQIVWALAKVNESFRVGNTDNQVDSYLLFSNPHQYGKSIEIRFSPIRVCCNNTLTAALNMKAKNGVSLSHASVFDAEQVKKTMGLASSKMEEYKEMAEFLASKEYTDETFDQFLRGVFGSLPSDKERLSRNGELAKELVYKQPGADIYNVKENFWNAFNVVTFMVDHTLGRTDDTRLTSAWFGQGETKKQKALKLALELADA